MNNFTKVVLLVNFTKVVPLRILVDRNGLFDSASVHFVGAVYDLGYRDILSSKFPPKKIDKNYMFYSLFIAF